MEYNFTTILHGFILPIMALFSIVGNCLMIAVYWKQCYKGSRMKRANNVILISMCASYMCVPLISLPWNVYAYMFRNLESSMTLELCYIWFMFKILPIIPHTGALLLTCVLSFQRFTAIRYPLRANIWWTYKKALVIVFVVYCINLPIHLPLFLAVEVSEQNLQEEVQTNTSNHTHIDCVSRISYSKFASDPKTFGIAWTFTRNLLLGTLPSCILLYVVIVTIKTLHRRHASEHTSTENAVVAKQPAAHSMDEGNNGSCFHRKYRHLTIPTRVVLSLAITQLLMHVLSSVCLSIDCLSFATNDFTLHRSDWISVVRPIAIVVMYIGTNAMFLYSCFMNTEFKMALKRLLHI